MLCCCSCWLELGCVDSCVEFDTGLVAAVSGEYTLKLKFNGRVIRLKQEQTMGMNITFDISSLVYYYTYSGVIITPSGDPVELTDGTLTLDCLRFKTEPILKNEEIC